MINIESFPCFAGGRYTRSPRLHTDLSDLVDMAGHDTDLAGIGGDNTGAVGSDETGLVLGLQSPNNLFKVIQTYLHTRKI
jgi:hypothetical protein